MAHNIHDKKIILMRQPAWHGLGLVIQEPMNATGATLKLGIPTITTESLQTTAGVSIPGYKAIIGKEEGKDPVVFSVVTNEYQEISHADFAGAWDRATNKAPVETIGLLGRGETLFISTKMPNFDVKGDECNNYLLAYNPLTGKDASTARITPVRVVCQNTMNQSVTNFTQQFKVIHTSDAAKDIEQWLQKVWSLSVAKAEAVKEAFDILAGFRISDNEFKDLLRSDVYIDPIRPESDGEGFLDKLASWEKQRKRIEEHREEVFDLYDGKAIGSDTEAFKGTAWGAWNSVVEYEDYGKSRRQASSALYGAGSDRKNAAFAELLALAR